MADVAVGFLLDNLKQLVLYNAELIVGAKDQVEALYSDLIVFKAFLRDSTIQRSHNNSLQALVNKIRSLVDKAEDVIDKLVVEMTRFKERSTLRRAIHGIDHSVTIRNAVNEIEFIRKDVKQIYEQKQFGFQALQLEELPDRGGSEKKPPVVEEYNVVGFDREAEAVINRLTGQNQDLDIIAITGMLGLGKTTLARKVYYDPAIEYKFSTRTWVHISQKYSIRKVLLSILSIFTQTSDSMNLSDEGIAEKLRKHLSEEKYLIVMDDVWTKEAWDDLKNIFPQNNKGSRILITTQHNRVAHHVNATKGPLHLKFLTKEESWKLLEKKVFGKEKCPSSEIQRHGQLIAAKCKGLPLAIVVIAGFLLNNINSYEWWVHVTKNVNPFIVADQTQIRDVIALPHPLKSCFLYLGVFPEGYEIPVWKLIRLWIAEGFIEQNEYFSLENMAEVLVEDFVDRNLLTVVQRKSNGQIKTCRVHDLLYEVCQVEAQKQKIYKEIKRNNHVTLDNSRRVCIHSDVRQYISSKPSGEGVRSFLCFDRYEIALPPEHASVIPKAFELLRVLDVTSIIFEIFPKDLLQLALLRYLALSCNINILPPSIFKLWNMQTLIFITTSRTLEFKEGMWKMYQLRHLHTNASALLPRPPSSTPEDRQNVQSLSLISPESCTEHVFARTPNIEKLGVKGKLVVLFDNLFDNVGRLQYLSNLKLINDVYPHSPWEGKIATLPPAFKFPAKLKKLTLSDTLLDWENMQIVGNLEKLEVLKLKNNAFTGEFWFPKHGGFRSLKVLHIGRTDLVIWEASEHHFPSLKRLVLQYCEKLEGLPLELADVASFQLLELYHSSKAAATSARNIQQKKKTKEDKDTNSSDEFKLFIYPSYI